MKRAEPRQAGWSANSEVWNGIQVMALALFAKVLCPTALAGGAWTAPVTPACISSPFGWRHTVGPNALAGFHNGVDLPAPAGLLVHAVADGVVAGIKRQGMGGVTVRLAHSDGRITLYAHLGNLVPALAAGKSVVRMGDALGHVARTGVTYGTHLFFAVFEEGKAVDPEPMLGVPRC